MAGMIRVGIFSDSHGDKIALRDALKKAGPLDAACFLGDYSWDASVFIDEGIPTCAVRGNNDFGSDAPDEALLSLGGVRIYCTHGHKFGVYYSLDRLYYRAREQEADIALFGHTHRPLLDNNGGLILLNPGSVALPRGNHAPTFALLEIKNGVAVPKIEYVYK
ncbi:MAG: metallophosphoesterase [Christensenellales bacterium]|jgi:putative phosphoesterase